jgi:hypothetical protein
MKISNDTTYIFFMLHDFHLPDYEYIICAIVPIICQLMYIGYTTMDAVMPEHAGHL